jgi:hypothetical protein
VSEKVDPYVGTKQKDGGATEFQRATAKSWARNPSVTLREHGWCQQKNKEGPTDLPRLHASFPANTALCSSTRDKSDHNGLLQASSYQGSMCQGLGALLSLSNPTSKPPTSGTKGFNFDTVFPLIAGQQRRHYLIGPQKTGQCGRVTDCSNIIGVISTSLAWLDHSQ